MKLTHTRAYRALLHRQQRHHDLAAKAATPRDQIAEELRHLRAVTDLLNLDDPAVARLLRAKLAAATADVSGLYLDVISGDLAVTR